MTYNPFDNKFNDLQFDDLQNLITQQVAEGYYVEYKREMPTPKKIAQSIASFANTYGGWYIVGLETDEHNVAIAIPGFAPESCHDPISVVRDSVKHYVDPVPVFFPHIIKLDTGSLVLTVYIPDRQESPFITKDGRLYRRTHDSSNPVPEESRYALDQLVERGKEVSKRFAQFSQDERTFSESEENGWLKIYISPYPIDLIEHPEIIYESGITNLINASKETVEIPISLPNTPEIVVAGRIQFDAAHPTCNSVILRKINNIQHEAFNSLVVELDTFGRAKFLIPLPETQLSSRNISNFRSTIVRQQLQKRLEINGGGHCQYLKLFDIGQTWLVVAILANYYLKWLGSLEPLAGFQIALELDDVWRHVPFYDIDSWGKYIEQFGLPVLMRNYVRFPEGTGKGQMFNVKQHELWLGLCGFTSLAFGLTPEFFSTAIGSIIVDAYNTEKVSSSLDP